MNKIYRTVWSDALQCWIAAAENVRRGGRAGGAVAVLAAAAVAAPAAAADMNGVPGLLNSRLTEGAGIGMPVGAVQQQMLQPARAVSASPMQSQMAAALGGAPANAAASAAQTAASTAQTVASTAQTAASTAQAAVAAPSSPHAVPPSAQAAAADDRKALATAPTARTALAPAALAAEPASLASAAQAIAPIPAASTFSMSSNMLAAPMAAAAAAPPPEGSVPPPLSPAPPTGLVVGTAGLFGSVGQGLSPLTMAAFNSQQDWLRSGALSVNRDNINARFRVVNLIGLPVLDLAPVTGTLSGGGSLPDQRLTLLGGVTSGNYITNINSGLTYKNGLLLSDTATAPDYVTANNCLNVLNLVGATCWDVPAAQNNQVLVGDGASANGSQEVVIGTGARHLLPNEDASTIFTDPTKPGVPTDDYSLRKGYSVVIGDNAFGNANAQTILGAGASSTVAGGVALGYQSVADRTGSGVEAYSKVAVPTQGAVSVGAPGSERQITNVAGGTADTDAVNLRQLKALESTIETGDANAVQYDDGTKKVVTLQGGTGGTRITNVANGDVSATSTDAVNGSQLNATNENVTNISNTVTNIDNNGTKYFRANSTLAGAAATGADTVAAGGAAQAGAANAVALGSGANASQANSVALGAGSITTVGAQTGYAAFALAAPQTSAGEVSVGSVGAERKITNVAAGADDTDAANVAQLKALNQQIDDVDSLAVKYDSTARTSITLNPGGPSTLISNVAPGAETSGSTQAVNGSQLWHWTQDTTNQISNTSLYDLIKNIQQGDPNLYFKVRSAGGEAQATGTESLAAGGGTTATGSRSVAVGNAAAAAGDDGTATGNGAQASGAGSSAVGSGAVASGTGSSAVGSGSTASGARATALGSNAQASADNSVALGADSVADRANTVSVGSAGNERQITNVADGTEDTDAANVRQLKAVSGDVTNITEGKDGMFQVENSANRPKPVASGTDSAAGGAGAVASGAASTAVGNTASATGANATALGNGAQAAGQGATALGSGAQASGQNATALSAGAVASGNNAIAVGNGAQAQGSGALSLGNGAQVGSGATNAMALGNGASATATNSVALGAGSSATVGAQSNYRAYGLSAAQSSAGEVSVGAAGAERKITNVAAGSADTDAVNVQQLRGATADIGNSISSLRDDMRGIERNANAGAASAMAVAGLPQAYAPGRSMASAAASHYLGQSAIAVGVSTISENGRWVYKFAGNVNTQGKVGAVIGAGYQW
ncbi:YadA-like family protein [Pigmentiphaga soli]|uniref:YadA-like family protein n=1 Tax=Pigmentiphaga soli TaxID=1007095 RepID=UPI0031ED98E3